MADKNFSSANKAISIAGGGSSGGINAKALIGGMTKDVKKRWLIVGGVAIAAMVGASTWVSSGSAPAPVMPKKDAGVVDTTPKGMSSQKDWKAQTGAEMAQLRKQLEESQRSQRELAVSMDTIRKELQRPNAARDSAPAAAAGKSSINLNLPPPPEPPKSLVPAGAPQGAIMTPGAGALTPPPAAPAPAAEPVRAAARAFIPTSAVVSETSAATQTDEMALNERRGFLPAGSFAKASMISGVEAFTGGTAQAQPQPVVVRLDANAVLPNAAAYQVKGCHVLASVWGDMSSERVFGRLATLTCVDNQNRLVLSEEVEGTLVDSDGKNGVRGTLQDRQGAKLARSLLAGFAEGMANALGAAQSTVSTTALGSTSSIQPDKMFRSSTYSGAEKAAENLSEFYLKQAEATMPVIAVDAGRKISVLFTKSKALKFETTDAYRVEPKKKMHIERQVN